MKFKLAALRCRAAFILAGSLAGAVLLAVFLLPFPVESLQSFPSAIVLADRLGNPLRVKLGPEQTDCRPVYEADPEHWICKAVVAAEDRRFWRHPGVDIAAVSRAVVQNVAAWRTVSGASTLSTQVIRMVERRPRTLWAKGVEAFRALQMETRLSKGEILSQYLNRAPFGSNIAGIEAASFRYFGKRAQDLSLGEAALLAGLPQSPSRFRPDRHFARARKRQAYVLDRMVACGMISGAERAAAARQPLAVRRQSNPFEAPHFCDYAAALTHFEPGTCVVRTTLDPDLQRMAERALRRQIDTLAGTSIRGGAVVVLDVAEGAVRAMAGSGDFFDAAAQGQVNAALAARSAGSTLKPFAYALAFDSGVLTPRTMLADVPMQFPDYKPENFDETFYGLVSARDALILSLNIPALQVEKSLGQPRLYGTLRDLGFSTLMRPAADYGMGLVLGNGEVRLLDLANAYACLARGGTYQECRVFETDGVESGARELRNQSSVHEFLSSKFILPRPNVPGRRLFSAEACWLISEALGGEERAADATGHSADARIPPLAWKTGTSAGFRDAWTVAYNPRYVIGVWVGRLDGGSSDLLVGKRVATPVVWEIFRRLYPDNDGPWFEKPAGLGRREVCAETGCLPGANCGARAEDAFIKGVTLQSRCAVHARAGEAHWPPDVAQFLARRNESRAAPSPFAQVRIVKPVSGSAYRYTDALSPQSQKLPLQAVSDAQQGVLHWFVDNRYVGSVRGDEPLFWNLREGRHLVVCSDPQGHSDRADIVVE